MYDLMKWKGRIDSHLQLFNALLWLVTRMLWPDEAAVTSPHSFILARTGRFIFAMICGCLQIFVCFITKQEHWFRYRELVLREIRERLSTQILFILHFYFIALNADTVGKAIQYLIHRVVQCVSTTGPLSLSVYGIH